MVYTTSLLKGLSRNCRIFILVCHHRGNVIKDWAYYLSQNRQLGHGLYSKIYMHCHIRWRLPHSSQRPNRGLVSTRNPIQSPRLIFNFLSDLWAKANALKPRDYKITMLVKLWWSRPNNGGKMGGLRWWSLKLRLRSKLITHLPEHTTARPNLTKCSQSINSQWNTIVASGFSKPAPKPLKSGFCGWSEPQWPMFMLSSLSSLSCSLEASTLDYTNSSINFLLLWKIPKCKSW